ncbi:chymotrypsin-like elastase family member 2A [Caerostris extrusa]|uniref:Chymotrypsin-like elastase family member 2A n=1 Tax=Caerostris extrusa TaxID=172846 RepID=A0AAV4MAX6_CAEEX|nr:chymotrypsin-like elastase family member 2A [Caerostris extrusa]
MDIQISTRCSDDKLTFLGEDESKIITVLCGSELPRPVYSLKGDKMIKFRLDTDYIGTGRGFHIYYEASPT